jgi:hypothetical protein
MSTGHGLRKCFVSAPLDTQPGPLIQALRVRGWEPQVLTDVVSPGQPVIETLRSTLAAVELVIVVLAAKTADHNSIVEAGMALALGKSIVVVAEPGVPVPSDLNGVLVVQAAPDDVAAVTWALDRTHGRLIPSAPGVGWKARGGLGPSGPLLLERARSATMSEQELERLVVDAIEATGAAAVQSAGMDRGFDIGVWSDELESIGGNPLLIEIKHRMSSAAIRQSLLALHGTPSARLALIIYREPANLGDYPELQSPLLAIQLESLLKRMQQHSFAEVVRDLRNRSVHGLPPA